MQVESFPAVLDWVIHGGTTGFLAFAFYVGFKINARLNRDDSLRSDYPPHRHINGSIVYPKEYEPARTDRLP